MVEKSQNLHGDDAAETVIEFLRQRYGFLRKIQSPLRVAQRTGGPGAVGETSDARIVAKMRGVHFMLMRLVLTDDLLHLCGGGREFALPVENVAQRKMSFKKHVGVAALAGMIQATLREFATGLKLAAKEVERGLAKQDTEQLRRVAELDAQFTGAVEGALHLRRGKPSRDQIGGSKIKLESKFLLLLSSLNGRKKFDGALQILNRTRVSGALQHLRSSQRSVVLLTFVVAGMGPVIGKPGSRTLRLGIDLLDRLRHALVELRAFILFQAGEERLP